MNPNNRLNEEKKTVELMIMLYCRYNHGCKDSLCNDCSSLLDYSLMRLDNCCFKASKPVCGRCKIHCYKKTMRDKIKAVMRYSGPRMVLFHPILAIKHLIRKYSPLKYC